MPAVAWSPGDLKQAHTPNEYIELDKLFKMNESSNHISYMYS